MIGKNYIGNLTMFHAESTNSCAYLEPLKSKRTNCISAEILISPWHKMLSALSFVNKTEKAEFIRRNKTKGKKESEQNTGRGCPHYKIMRAHAFFFNFRDQITLLSAGILDLE